MLPPSGLIRFIISKNKFAQAIEAAVECFSVIRAGECIYKLNEIWILSDHKCSNRDIQFAAGGCQIECSGHDCSV